VEAYLSTQAAALNDTNSSTPRDRIGAGPWRNAKGVVVAQNVADLHSPSSNLTKATAIDEKGNSVNGRTDQPNNHDMLTGSRPDGTAFAGAPFSDMTCGNWTKGGTEGSAMLGHHDLAGRSTTCGPSRGTRRTRPGAATPRACAAPAARACSTASRPTDADTLRRPAATRRAASLDQWRRALRRHEDRGVGHRVDVVLLAGRRVEVVARAELLAADAHRSREHDDLLGPLVAMAREARPARQPNDRRAPAGLVVAEQAAIDARVVGSPSTGGRRTC
jgi:hypothetical protein